MPHSSGGGSSGGGSHSGSSSSGSSSRYSSRPFAGSTPYVYYGSDYTPHLIYTNVNPAASGRANIVSIVMACLFLVAPWLLFIFIGSHNPTKLNTNYTANLVLEDQHDILSLEEENEIQAKFEEFYNVSGIMPGLLCVYDEDWPSFNTLEDFAYRRYLSFYDDEKHWLIVYSTYPNDASRWRFEGMQGNDTDNILTPRVTDTFNAEFESNLHNSSFTVGISLVNAFDAILPSLMESSFYIDTPMIIFGVVWSGISGVFLATSIVNAVRSKPLKNAVKAPDDVSLQECPNCHASYYSGTVDRCPRCGSDVDYPRYAHFPK